MALTERQLIELGRITAYECAYGNRSIHRAFQKSKYYPTILAILKDPKLTEETKYTKPRNWIQRQIDKFRAWNNKY